MKTIGHSLGSFQAALEALRRRPTTPCPDCGAGHYGAPGLCWDCEERGAAKARWEAARLAALEEIPLAYREATIEGYTCPPGSQVARSAADRWQPTSSSPWLYLWSQGTGTGKTHIACALARRAVESGRRPLVVGESELLAEAKRAMGGAYGASQAVVDRYAYAGMLVLDDVGTSNPTPYSAEVLFLVIDARVKERLPTVLTSNHSLREVGERIGGEHGRRIGSRLVGACQGVEVRASDYRVRR